MIKKYSILVFTLFLSLFIFFLIPQTTFASVKITISGNGAGSQNSVSVSNNNPISIIQTNFTSLFTSIFNKNNTGNNTSNGNTNGNTFIKTGNSNSSVTENFTESSNNFTVPEFSIFQGIVAGGLSLIGYLMIKKRFI